MASRIPQKCENVGHVGGGAEHVGRGAGHVGCISGGHDTWAEGAGCIGCSSSGGGTTCGSGEREGGQLSLPLCCLFSLLPDAHPPSRHCPHVVPPPHCWNILCILPPLPTMSCPPLMHPTCPAPLPTCSAPHQHVLIFAFLRNSGGHLQKRSVFTPHCSPLVHPVLIPERRVT